MTRRTPTIAAVLAVAAVLSGCATFTDDRLAARVGDAELTHEQLADLTREALGDDEAARAPIDATNGVLTSFILNEALRADLEALGQPIDESDDELTFESLQAAGGEAFNAWQAIPPAPTDPADLEYHYNLGPVRSNITCTRHILVEDEDIADEVMQRLDDGDDFGELAAEYSIDPGSAATGGVIPCTDTQTFASAYVPEYVDAALTADIGEPVGPVLSQFGYHVIEVREFADLEPTELDPFLTIPQIRFDLATTDLDVYVDPRYGAFESSRGVIPLG